MRAALVIVLIEFDQALIDFEAVVVLEQFDHVLHPYPLVGGVRGDLLEKNLVDVDQQLALEFKLFAVLEVVVFELLLLVSFGRSSDFWVVVFRIRLFVLLFSHIPLHFIFDQY
jgi:hypothetical protein